MIRSKGFWSNALWFMALFAGLLLSAQSAAALEEAKIRIGKFRLYPSVSYTGHYHTNIFAEKEDEEGDYIHVITPSIRFEIGSGMLGISGGPGAAQAGVTRDHLAFGYAVDFAAFTEYSDNNYITHRPFATFGLNFPGPFYLHGDERFIKTSDIFGTKDLYGVGEQVQRWENEFGLVFGYELTNIHKIELMYQNYIRRFDEHRDKWQDRIDHTFGILADRNITAKTSVFAEYRRTYAEFDKQNDGILNWTDGTSRDYVTDKYFLGVRFRPRQKFYGDVRLGYGEYSFDNKYDPYGRRYRDQESWIAETGIYYLPRKNSRLSFQLSRGFSGSPDADASSSIETLAGIHLQQRLGTRFTADLGFEWNRVDYAGEHQGRPRKYFDFYTAQVGFISEIFSWLNAGFWYEYEVKEANDSFYRGEEHEINVFSIRADVHL